MQLDCGCRPPREAWLLDDLIGVWRLRDRHVCDSGVLWGWCEDPHDWEEDEGLSPPQAEVMVETRHGIMEMCGRCHDFVMEGAGR